MGCVSEWRSSLPDAVTDITPDPYRGVGRKNEAHIRVQKEPVIWPAGAGTDYFHPEGSPHKPGRMIRGPFREKN